MTFPVASDLVKPESPCCKVRKKPGCGLFDGIHWNVNYQVKVKKPQGWDGNQTFQSLRWSASGRAAERCQLRAVLASLDVYMRVFSFKSIKADLRGLNWLTFHHVCCCNGCGRIRWLLGSRWRCTGVSMWPTLGSLEWAARSHGPLHRWCNGDLYKQANLASFLSVFKFSSKISQ